MWRNADVLDFVGWLREYNDGLASDSTRVGFYGLDLYSLHTSIEAVLKYLDKVDSEGARRARARYSCFDHFGEDLQAYGYATGLGLSESCENEAIDQLHFDKTRAVEPLERASEWEAGEAPETFPTAL
jgi:erythromycin esterase-like protein